MPKERSLPQGYKKRTEAPKWHQEVADLTWELLKVIRECKQGDLFSDENFLCLYRFLLEYGSKKNESDFIPWSRVVQAVSYISALACVPFAEPEQLKRAEKILRQIVAWKAQNLHYSQLTELTPEQKVAARRQYQFRLKKGRDDEARLRAIRASKWTPKRV